VSFVGLFKVSTEFIAIKLRGTRRSFWNKEGLQNFININIFIQCLNLLFYIEKNIDYCYEFGVLVGTALSEAQEQVYNVIVLDDSEDGIACPTWSVKSEGEGSAENASTPIYILVVYGDYDTHSSFLV